MRGKNKSFLEDIIVLFVLGVIIYAIYSFFFSSNENIETENNKIAIEKSIDSKELMPDEIKKEELLEEEIDKNINQVQKDDLPPEAEKIIKSENITESVSEEKISTKEPEKPSVDGNDEKAKIELFYNDIREKIYKSIKTDFDNKQFNNGELVNIRLTILKSGKFEQLTFMDGNNDYFNIIKPSIIKVFPVELDETLKDNFPRYFRMKIEF